MPRARNEVVDPDTASLSGVAHALSGCTIAQPDSRAETVERVVRCLQSIRLVVGTTSPKPPARSSPSKLLRIELSLQKTVGCK